MTERTILDLIDKVHSQLDNLYIDCTGAREENLTNEGTANKKEENFCMKRLHFPYYELGHVASMLHTNSYQSLISLLIYARNLDSLLSIKELIKVALKKLPKGKLCILLNVDEYLTSEDMKIHGSIEDGWHELTSKTNFLAYFFGSVEQRSRIDVAWMSGDKIYPQHFCQVYGRNGKLIEKPDENHIDMECQRIVDELDIKNCKYSNSTVLLIGQGFDSVLNKILKKLHKSAPDGHEISWMCLNRFPFKAASDSNNDKYWHLTALRISGTGVQSWNTKFFVHEDVGDIARKLHALKKKVTRKQHCIGLITSPKCRTPECSHELHPYGVSHVLMQFITFIFPDIPFVGLFKDEYSIMRQSHNEKSINDIFKSNDDETGEIRDLDLDLITTVMIISQDSLTDS